MAAPAIKKGSNYFFATTYEGNGGGQKVGNFVPFTDSGTIDNSCIFNATTNNYLARTPSSNGSGTTLTFSCWVKRGFLGTRDFLYTGNITSISEHLLFDSSNRLQYYEVTSGSRKWDYVTNRTFEDTSKWYHIYVRRDTTDSTAADRIQIYVDGERITSFATSTQPSLNATGYWNQTTYAHNIGTTGNASYIRGIGYLAEVNMVDGSTPAISTFGETDTSTGRWVPKTLSGITYGTNGFRFEFKTASQLGDDTSGNTNDFTATNLASTDQTTDSPTQNHATLSPHSLYKSSNYTLSEGNLKATSTSVSGTHSGQGGMRIPSGGKYYWEVEIDSGKDGMGVGIIPDNTPTTSANPGTQTMFLSSGSMRTDGSNALSYGSGVSNGDIIGFALDLSDPQNGKLWVSVNGTYQNSGNPVTGANPAPARALIGDFRVFYQDGSNGYTPVYIFNFGQKSFNTAAPTGYSALQQDNFPDEGVKPDLVWIKNRDATDSHQLYDSSRGAQKDLNPDSTADETTTVDGLQKFLKDGCQIEDDVSINTSGESYVAWNWVCNGGTTSANTDGSGATLASTIQANQTAGFSIVQYTGAGAGARTINHGLSQAPEWIIVKNLTGSSSYNWNIYHIGMDAANPSDYFMSLNTTNARDNSANLWNDTSPTSTVFSVNHEATAGASGNKLIAYCWHSVAGFSRFGSYVGNGNANGPFIYTGFKPAWVMYKQRNTTNYWAIFDSTRSVSNVMQHRLAPNYNYVENVSTANQQDFLSNGIKLRGTDTTTNQNGGTYVYMAFAEHPFIGSSSISPVTAR